MTFREILTFEEALKKADDFGKQYPDYKEKQILLGNGFSIDCCKDIFTYSSLFEGAMFSEHLKEVFKNANTNDFEKIIKTLQNTSNICKIYDFNNEQTKQLIDDSEKIKTELVRVISKKHPEHQHKIKDYKFYSAYKFLSNFSKIFTLNYDMLLYWTLMLENRSPNILRKLKISFIYPMDGFGDIDGELTWYKTKKQNIFYLHGALHLFDDGISIIKAETTNDLNLLDIIKENLKNENYPLIVTEGFSTEKLEKISHNKYLQNAFDNLRYIGSNVFIHGHSLDDNDSHILNAIRNSWTAKQIFISVHEPEVNFENIKERALRFFVDGLETSKKIFFYDAKTANIWNLYSEEEISGIDFSFCKENKNDF